MLKNLLITTFKFGDRYKWHKFIKSKLNFFNVVLVAFMD